MKSAQYSSETFPKSGQRKPTSIRYMSFFFFMTKMEWMVSVICAFVFAGIAYPLYKSLSLWVGVGLFLSVFSLFNAAFATRYCIPFPQITVLLCCIQLILGAWGNWYFPTNNTDYDIGFRLSTYLAYAGPASLALAVGIYFPFLFNGPRSFKTLGVAGTKKDLRLLRQCLNILLVGGIISTICVPLLPGNLQFLGVLAGNLRYVAIFGFILSGMRGWKSRVIIVVVLEGLFALKFGMFHEGVLWFMACVFILAHHQKWKGHAVLCVIVTGMLAVMMLQSVKIEFREQFWSSHPSKHENRFVYFSKTVYAMALSPFKVFSNDRLSSTMLRLNQGWIVNQAMLWTPSNTPFANGETIVRAFAASVTPRVLNPDKFYAGGGENFERFTGRKLLNRTSMDLGFAGEMYVNFGYAGGVLAVGIYGLLLGLGYRWVSGRAIVSPLWWAWAAYVAIVAVKAETSVGMVLNWITKATFVMAFVVFAFPPIKRALFPNLPNRSVGTCTKTAATTASITPIVRE